MGSPTGTTPLPQRQPPERTEHDDEGHMQGPARELVFPELRRSHAVEEKLQIPGKSCYCTEKEIERQPTLT